VTPRYFHHDFLETPDGAEIYFEVQGPDRAEGPDVVLCDGLGCDGFVWRYLLPVLRRRHRILHWNYRGHGRSSLPPEPDRIGMQHTCDDLVQVMERVGFQDAVVFGHSMGVQVALEFHRQQSARVKGLALLCGSYGNPLDTFHDTNFMRHVLPLMRETVERYPEQARKGMHTFAKTEIPLAIAVRTEMNGELIHRTDVEAYFNHLARMTPLAFVRTLDSLAAHTALDHLPRVDVPALVIAGERDQFTPRWLSERMAKALPRAELLVIHDGTHTAPLERPELVNQRVERFLAERIA
jgi:pimeloyl-ACP methyl ester carboxylesterase